MKYVFALALAVVVFLAFKALPVKRRSARSGTKAYRFRRKKYLLTKSENIFLHALNGAVGGRYEIFAQVHLSSLLDHKVKGQNWRGAFAHINGKSVDFVLCEKDNYSPVLAIELDDSSHERSDRRRRDAEVERIFLEAHLPLLRFDAKSSYSIEELRSAIEQAENK